MSKKKNKKTRTMWTDFCPIKPVERVVKDKKKENSKKQCRKPIDKY